MKRLMRVGIVVGLTAALVAVPASVAQAEPRVDDDGIVWIYGQVTKGYSCWTKGSKGVQLQMRDGRGKWQTVAVGKPRTGSRDCTGKYPVKMEYRFVVSEIGSRRAPGSRGYMTEVREITTAGRAYPFTKTVYATKADHVADLGDAFCEILTGEPC